MANELATALVSGGFTLAGIAIGAGLTYLGSYFEHRRRRADELRDSADREFAILHGALAVCNFINSKLNDWDQDRCLTGLVRLSVVQPYLTKLIDRAPHSSDRLMITLVDLGLQLESLMFVIGYSSGGPDQVGQQSLDVEKNIAALAQAVEMVEVIVTGELPFLDADEEARLLAKQEESQ